MGPQHLPVTLYVASDVAFKKHRAFRDGLGALEAAARAHAGGGDRDAPAVRVVALRDVVKDAYVALAAATPGLEDGRALAALPDVEMHLDLLLCARAPRLRGDRRVVRVVVDPHAAAVPPRRRRARGPGAIT